MAQRIRRSGSSRRPIGRCSSRLLPKHTLREIRRLGIPVLKLKGKTPLSASIMAADKIRSAAIKAGIRLVPGQRFGFHNLHHSLATFLVSRGKDVKTIQELRRHAKVTTTLDLYSQAIDAAKLEAQEEIALAIRTSAAAAD
jgi:integrase